MIVRWCRWCGSAVTVGVHDANGDFDPSSVTVSDEEINASGTGQRWARYHNWRAIARWNIAFGKHIGTYQRGVY